MLGGPPCARITEALSVSWLLHWTTPQSINAVREEKDAFTKRPAFDLGI